MKKVVLWYNILQKLGQLVKDEPEPAKKEAKESAPAIKSKSKTAAKPKAKTVSKPESKSATAISKGKPKSK